MPSLYGRGTQCCWGKVTNTCDMEVSSIGDETLGFINSNIDMSAAGDEVSSDETVF